MHRTLPLALILSFAASVHGALTATHADLDVMRQRLIEAVLPAGADADEVVRQAKAHASKMTAEHTWPDIDTTGQERSNWELRPHLDRALLLAKAAALSRRDGKPDPELVKAAVGALDYWIKNDFKNPNWWWNEIGVPQLTGECVLLLADDCPPGTRDGVVNLMKRSVWTKWTGQNLVWGVAIQISRGLITNDPDLVSAGYGRMYQEVVVTPKEGIQPDYSFQQHGAQFYSGGYGLSFAQDVGRYIAYAWGTGCQPPADVLKTFDHFMLDGQAWMTWGPLFDYSALGREIVRPGKAAVSRDWAGGPVVPMGAAYGLGRTAWLLSQLPVPRQAAYAAWTERLLSPGESGNAPPLVGHKHFWRSDYTAHRRPDYLFSVKMFSKRLINTELVNNEGKKSHHLGDGNTFLYRTGQEYRDIFPVWDWQKLPGTTAEQTDGDLDELLPKGNRARGLTDFVGGVSDDQYGVSAMLLRRGNLSARKSWFFFDDEIVCLGSSIQSESDNPVVTAVEQCFSTDSLSKGPSNAWVHHADVGYVFPDNQDVRLTDGPQSGAWSDIGVGPSDPITKDVFSLWIDHGTRPRNASYAYILLPGRSRQDTAAYAARPSVDIEQTPIAHVVRSAKLQTTAVVFFEPGAAAGIETDRPCILLFRGGRLSVCDPAQGGGVIHLKVNGHPVHVQLPTGLLAGSSVTVDVR